MRSSVEFGPVRIFVAGATGVIGSRLVPLLTAAGHEITAMTRSVHKVEQLSEAGARPTVCDVFDFDRLVSEVSLANPDLVIHQLTDLPDDADQIPLHEDRHARIRTEGTANLLAASSRAGVERVIAQSVAWTLPGVGGDAVASLERQVLDHPGVVLRYGRFHGPSTYYVDTLPPSPRVHVAVAAERTLEALSIRPPDIVTVLDGDSDRDATRRG